MDSLEKYLIDHKFENRLKELIKKLKNKSVLVYGTGKLFKTIIKNYDLSGLNIVGISDKKYLVDDEFDNELGYPVVPFEKIHHANADYILLSVQNYPSLMKKFIKLGFKPIPLVEYTFVEKLMSKFKIRKKPKNNTFVLVKTNGKRVYNPKIKNLKVKFWGDNNYVEIHEPFKVLESTYISCRQNNAKVIIGANNNYKNTTILIEQDCEITVGRNTTVENLTIHLINADNTKLTIGEDCMFSYRVYIRTSDVHSIYDKSTRKLLNPPKNITIGDHVWIAADTTIIKGAVIPSNCMVGTGSLINKQFSEENCILAGSPAKVLKTGINWDRRSPSKFA